MSEPAADAATVRPPAPRAAAAAPLSATAAQAGHLLHSGMTVARFHSMHFLGAVFPLTAGVMLFGWRAAVAVAVVVGSAWAALGIWGRLGRRGRQIDRAQTVWLALLLAMMLPAQLASDRPDVGGEAGWPVLVAAGVALVMILWALGGLGVSRVHPVVACALLLLLLFPDHMTPQWVLQRNHLITGDLLKGPRPAPSPDPRPWVERPPIEGQDAFWMEPAAGRLTHYTTGVTRPDRGQLPLHELLRDRMPPLEDLIVGGQPGPVGAGSAIAVIIGGLFLLYRGLIDFRVPLLVVVVAFVTLMVLPIPTVIRDDGSHYRWLALREPDVRWETAVTFVNYELMAGPLLFVAFFLATSPAVRPLGRRVRVLYAVLVGSLCAVAQLYASVAWGPYFALLLAGLASPAFDRWFKPRALV